MPISLYNVEYLMILKKDIIFQTGKKQKKMNSKIALLKKVSHNPSYIIKRTI